jgi:hypothetical protein
MSAYRLDKLFAPRSVAAAMLDVCRNLGFQVKADPEEPSLVVVTLSL